MPAETIENWTMKKQLLLFFALVAIATSMKAQEAYAVFTQADNTLMFYYDDNRSSRPGTSYDLNLATQTPGWLGMDNYGSKITKVVFDSSFANARPTSTFSWFNGMTALTSITGISYLNTSEVTNMSKMFASCSSLTSLDVSHFNTSKVFDMSSLFSNCSLLTSLDVSNFNTSGVRNMAYMFDGCRNITSLVLSSFNTANVTGMTAMFFNCRSLTTLSLNSFITSKVKSMNSMFASCVNLQSIFVSEGWNTDKATKSQDVFTNCYALVGEKGTTYANGHYGVGYAHIDGGTSNPGYLSYKPLVFRENNIYYSVTGANAVEVTYKDETYNNYQGSYSGNVLIPPTVNCNGTTYNVTSIGEYAFYLSQSLSKVTIPSSVTTIGDYAFYSCPSLLQVKCFATTPPTIYSHTFSSYYGLIVPQGSIAAYQAAEYWKNFYSISEMHPYDFEFEGIYYKETEYGDVEVSYSEDGTYSGNVVIPESLTTDEWFYTVSAIGEKAFYRCPYLTSVTIPATVDIIHNDAFVDAFFDSKNSSITCLATRPPIVSPSAFDSAIGDMTLYVPYGSKSAYEAAAYWKDFGTITELPYTFKKGSFYYKITGDNTLELSYKDYNDYWGNVTIQTSVTYKDVTYTVTTVGEKAFYNCSRLRSVIIPSTVTSIGSQAFHGCTALQSGDITCWATEPPTIVYNTFDNGHYQGSSLYVPYGCYDAYAQADFWKNFSDIYSFTDGIKDVNADVNQNDIIYSLSGQRLNKMQKGINIVNGRKIVVK